MVDYTHIRDKIKKKDYKFIGAGSGRNVYDMNNRYVIKVAKNRKGIAQNKAEYDIYKAAKSELFAKIIDISDDYRFLIMVKAQRVSSIGEIWNYYHVKSNRELSQLDWFRNLYDKHGLLKNDLFRKMNWGVINGKPVIIDYGFTKTTSKLYTFLF